MSNIDKRVFLVYYIIGVFKKSAEEEEMKMRVFLLLGAIALGLAVFLYGCGEFWTPPIAPVNPEPVIPEPEPVVPEPVVPVVPVNPCPDPCDPCNPVQPVNPCPEPEPEPDPCPNCPPANCIELPPNVAGSVRWDCATQEVIVDATSSRDTDLCHGGTAISTFEITIVVDGVETSLGRKAMGIIRFSIGDAQDGLIFITIYDNDEAANTSSVSFERRGGSVVFSTNDPDVATPNELCEDPCPPGCEDQGPLVVAEISCQGDQICVDATGSHDTDSCGSPSIVLMEVKEVGSGRIIYSDSGLQTCFSRPNYEAVLVTCWDNEGTSDTRWLNVPACDGGGPGPCVDQVPEVVATLYYLCDENKIRVDARASYDNDSCGSTAITWMQLEIQGGVTFSGSSLDEKISVPVGVTSGEIEITIRDNEGTDGVARAHYVINGTDATFSEVL